MIWSDSMYPTCINSSATVLAVSRGSVRLTAYIMPFGASSGI